MDYTLISDTLVPYTGSGDTLHDAILDALTKLGQAEISDLDHAKRWCVNYLNNKYMNRKSEILDTGYTYTTFELIAMFAEARDYAITGNTTPARYPLANSVATAKGVTLVSVLQGWGTAILSKLQELGAVTHSYESGVDLITSSATLEQLLNNMSQIIEYIEMSE